MQQHASTYSVLTLTLGPWGLGSKGQNSSFSEHGHVAYQIKGNHKCSNMQGHILSLHTLDPWGGVKGQNNFFLKVVILHIKLKGMEHRAPCKHIFCPLTHTLDPGVESKIKTFFFSESSHVVYIKLKPMDPRAPCTYIFYQIGSKGQNIFCLKVVSLK